MSYTPPKEVGDRAADILGVMTPVPARGGRPVGVMPIHNPADRLMRRAAHRGRGSVPPLSHCQGLVLPRTTRGDDIAGH